MDQGMNDERHIDALIERVASPWRDRSLDGTIQSAPAFHDLSERDRAFAFEQAIVSRQLEAALDPDGLSSTARSILTRFSQ